MTNNNFRPAPKRVAASSGSMPNADFRIRGDEGVRNLPGQGDSSSSTAYPVAPTRSRDAALQELPIWQERDKIIKLIQDYAVVLVQGSTGVGKSTAIPFFC